LGGGGGAGLDGNSSRLRKDIRSSLKKKSGRSQEINTEGPLATSSEVGEKERIKPKAGSSSRCSQGGGEGECKFGGEGGGKNKQKTVIGKDELEPLPGFMAKGTWKSCGSTEGKGENRWGKYLRWARGGARDRYLRRKDPEWCCLK